MIYFFYQGLILRIAGAAMVSFMIVMVLAPHLIRFLVKKKLGDRPEFDNVDLNQLTRHKSNTPTMGGILIVVAIFCSVVGFANLGNMYIRLALVALIWLGALGAADDWIKIRRASGKTSRDGLKSWEKILFQVGLGVLLSIYLYAYGGKTPGDPTLVNPAHTFYFPFVAHPIDLSLLAYTVITVITVVGMSNAVNLSDGMDGLASGCMIIAAGVFVVLCWVVGNAEWALFFHLPAVREAAEVTVVCASMIGACLGFLWYNAHPAQVFMGDTGSLPLGGLLGYIAVVTRHEIVLLVAGGIFVMEALSVILQVGYFKLTKPKGGMQGRRLFRCAPLHHHFHLGGWAETKVVTRFWILGLIFAALAVAMLKLR